MATTHPWNDPLFNQISLLDIERFAIPDRLLEPDSSGSTAISGSAFVGRLSTLLALLPLYELQNTPYWQDH